MCVCVCVRQHVSFDVLWLRAAVKCIKNNAIRHSCNFAPSTYAVCTIMISGYLSQYSAYDMGLQNGVKKPELEEYRLSPSTGEVKNECSCTCAPAARLRDVEREYVVCSGALARRRIASACLSVRPQGTTRLPLDGFS